MSGWRFWGRLEGVGMELVYGLVLPEGVVACRRLCVDVGYSPVRALPHAGDVASAHAAACATTSQLQKRNRAHGKTHRGHGKCARA